MAVDKFTP
ncbi:hypothetical protein ECPA39_5696, partial [Escherichia coli PA39]